MVFYPHVSDTSGEGVTRCPVASLHADVSEPAAAAAFAPFLAHPELRRAAAETLRLVLVDPPGSTGAAGFLANTTCDALAEQLHDALQLLHFNRVLLLGAGAGANVAIRLAVRAWRVEGLPEFSPRTNQNSLPTPSKFWVWSPLSRVLRLLAG